MANFGLHALRVAAPADAGWRSSPEAVARAAGARPVLEGARLYASAAEATSDLHLVIAATARSRGGGAAMDPVAAARAVVDASRAGRRTALLFGSERDGLSAEELRCADAVVTIDTARDFSSLNLATSVALCCYEWRRADRDAAPEPRAASNDALADEAEMSALFARLDAALDGRLRRDPTRASAKLRRLVARAAPTSTDVALLHTVVAALLEPHR